MSNRLWSVIARRAMYWCLSRTARRDAAQPTGNYAWAVRLIRVMHLPLDNSRGIVEIGARDALDSIQLARSTSTRVIAFEPDPQNFVLCQANVATVADEHLEIHLDSRCLSDQSGVIEFLAIDRDLYSNAGAGSLLALSFDDRTPSDPDSGRGTVQRQISVVGVRYDESGYPVPGGVFMDVQGADLLVLSGFGDMLHDVPCITLETALVSTYVGGATFRDIEAFLAPYGLRYVASTRYGLAKPPLATTSTGWTGDFDAVFARTSKGKLGLWIKLLRSCL